MLDDDVPDGERPSGPRSHKGAQTRARLLEAAKQVFEECGFLEARISDIAERAGLSYGSFYHYFNSKEETFREIARAQEVGLEAAIAEGAPPIGASTTAFLDEWLTSATRRYLADYRDEARIMRVIEQVSRFDEQLSAIRFERHERFSNTLAVVIRALQEVGGADPELDPEIVATALVALVTRLAEEWFVEGQLDRPFDEGVDELRVLLVGTLRGRGASPT
ncbi:MAG TPA: TetR/AcrR family transcriptional regulator [Acidimicrobiales bacterium]|nr:TetR/AcrR family transcriptional regulator [Acidimicrobiales bacterium]